MSAVWPLLACSLALGCADAIYSVDSFRSHEAYTDAAYARYREAAAGGVPEKADVLATLGPPIQVIAQESGEVFVYRRKALDINILNLNPGTVSGLGPTVPIPLYFGSYTRGRDDTLMIFFDERGRVRGESARQAVDPGASGPAPAAEVSP